MVTPRKYTWENNRATAIETLVLYEAGATPKQIAVQLDISTDIVWHRIKHGRKWRAKLEAAE